MLTKLSGGTLYDPAHGVDGETRDLYIRDGHILAEAPPNETPGRTFDLRGKLVMAGAIDLHTHIGGGKVNIARTMLPEDQRAHPRPRTPITRSGGGHAVPSTTAAALTPLAAIWRTASGSIWCGARAGPPTRIRERAEGLPARRAMAWAAEARYSSLKSWGLMSR